MHIKPLTTSASPETRIDHPSSRKCFIFGDQDVNGLWHRGFFDDGLWTLLDLMGWVVDDWTLGCGSRVRKEQVLVVGARLCRLSCVFLSFAAIAAMFLGSIA